MAADNFLFYFASGLTTAANESERRGERNAIWQRTKPARYASQANTCTCGDGVSLHGAETVLPRNR